MKKSHGGIWITLVGLLLIAAYFCFEIKHFKPQQPQVPETIVKHIYHQPKSRVFETVLFLQPKLDPFIAQPIAEAVEESCAKYGIPTSFVLALIRHESEFDPIVVSKAGAIGLMQILPKWHPEKVTKDLFIIKNNVDIGCQILSEYLRENNWDIYKALNSYLGKNAKRGEVKSYVLKILQTNLDIAFFLQTLPTEYEEKTNG